MQHMTGYTRGGRLHGLAPWAAAALFAITLASGSLATAVEPAAEAGGQAPPGATACTRPADSGEPFDRVHLGESEAVLREVWGDALESRELKLLGPDFQRLARPADAEKAGNPYTEQLRLHRSVAEGDIRNVEYDLFRGKIYRVRWKLSERFHAPIMDAIVRQGNDCYGEADYNQTIEAKLASGEVTRRRAGWSRDGKLLEIRQLNPLLGGPVFVVVTDEAASRALIAAGGSISPEPTRRDEPWWRRGSVTPTLPTESEREALARSIAAVLSQSDF
jgi:hypothetical protein